MKSHLLTLAFLLIPTVANAATDYCEISGLASGANKEFVASVAAEIANRQDTYGSPGCEAAMADAIKRGKRLLSDKPSKTKDEDLAKLLDFESEVLDAVINNMQPDR